MSANTNLAGRLCGCSFIHPGLSLEQGLAAVREFDFNHVDIGIGGGNGHLDAVQAAEKPQSFAAEIRREVEAAGLQANEAFVLNFGPPLNSRHQADRVRTAELFGGICELARLAGFRSVLLIPGPVHEEIGRQASLDLAVAACTELAAIAMDHGVLLNIEADCDSCANTPEAAAELCQRVPGIGLTLDYSHFVCQGIEPERVRALHPCTRHIHIRQAAPGQIVAEVQEGVIDYAEEIRLLEEGGYSGLYCIEYLSLENNPQTLARSEERTRAMAAQVSKVLNRL